jgi:hypothetical protein
MLNGKMWSNDYDKHILGKHWIYYMHRVTHEVQHVVYY